MKIFASLCVPLCALCVGTANAQDARFATAAANGAALPAARPPESAISERTWRVETDHPDALYRCGETATFTVTLQSTNNLAKPLDLVNVAVRLDNFGPCVVTNAVFDLSETNAFTISGTLAESGFLRVVLPQTKARGKDPSDFSAGFDPENIRKGSPSPVDFDEFWTKAIRDFEESVPVDPQLVPVPELSQGSCNYWRVSFAAPHGTRAYGFLSIPKDASAEKKYPARVQVPAAGHGWWTNHMPASDDAICMMMSVHPFDLPFDQEENIRRQDVVKTGLKERYGTRDYTRAGLDVSREDYYFYRAILGINRAVDWLAARPEVDLSNFTYSGTSQGGGFGFYLLGLNRHFTKGALFVPAITDTMGYLAGRQSGWPRPVDDGPDEGRQARERNAPYFDGANFASRIRCPVRVAVGFSDIVCAPCAVYAAFNEIRVADKGIVHGIGMTHDCFASVYSELGKWQREPSNPLEVVLSFDDGNREHADIVAPMLREYGFPGIFCIITDSVGRSPNSMTWDDVRRLVREGHEIASHTCSHPNLRELLEDGKTDVFQHEVADSATAIERETGIRPIFVCLPGNGWSPDVERGIAELGFKTLEWNRYGIMGGEGATRTARQQAENAVESAIADGKERCVLMFHGIVEKGWRPLPNGADDLRAVLDFLRDAERQGRIRVTRCGRRSASTNASGTDKESQ